MSEDFTHQPPTDRATILDRANQARVVFDEGQRKFTVKALCRDRFRSGPMYDGPATDLTDDEIIEAAYGPGGAGIYWRAWLLGSSGRPELAQAIAAHSAVSQDSFHRIWRALLSALDRAPTGGDLTADARWLAKNPNTRCFIPSSLDDTLTPGETVSPPQVVAPEVSPVRRQTRGGRPAKYDWARAAGYLSGFIVENDPPDKRDIVQALTLWFSRHGTTPDERDIRAFADEVWSAVKDKP